MKSSMFKNEQYDTSEPRIKNRFVTFSIVLFLIILVVGSIAFVFSLRHIVRENKDVELSQMLDIKQLRLESTLETKIAMVQKMANSPVIIQHFTNPEDAALRELAMEEINSFRIFFYEEYEISWVNDIDRLVFSTEFPEPYWLDADNPAHYWYYRTLYETEGYHFNVNFNPTTGSFKMWVNAPVLNNERKPVGMIALALEVTTFINTYFQDIEDGVELYLFNSTGEITGAKNVGLIMVNANIMNELGDLDIDIIDIAVTSGPGETRSFTIPQGTLAIGTVPSLGWYAAAFKPNNISDYYTPMTALFLVMLVVILLIFIIFNLFIAGFIKSINDTMTSLEKTKSELDRQRIAAETASKAKSMFLSTMSHEIRTPMNAVLGITEFQLYKDDLDPDVREALEKVYSSGELLLGIINDILDLSKIEAGKLELLPGKYDVASLVNDTAQLNMMRIGSKLINFELNIDEHMPAQLSGDELRIKQILNNLLSNAFKYTASGIVSLAITTEACAENSSKVILTLTVSDTGQGMTNEQVEKLFDEFARFNQEMNNTTEGTGLGMNITRNLVDLMDGSIEVDSNPGIGSTFTVRLPQDLISDNVLGKDIVENLQQFRTSGRAQMKNVKITREPMPYGKILVVDDVETNIYVTRGLLTPYQLTMDSAGSGFAAIKKIESGNVYDLIFMDHMMPKMDGVETTKRLRDMGYKDPIVALTANAVSGRADMFLKNGFDDFISKPIDLRQMNVILNKFIRDKQSPEVIESARQEALSEKSNVHDEPVQQIGNQLKQSFASKKIDGLDIFKGLKRYENNEKAFLEILHSYAKSTRSTLGSIKTVTEDSIHDYGVRVHGIKGASYDVFAYGVGKEAEILEHAASDGNLSLIQERNPAFLVNVEKLLDNLEDVLSAVEYENQKPKKEKPDNELLLKLLAACDAYSMENADATMTEIEEYQYTADDGLAVWLRENVNISNFQEILERLSDYLE